MNAFDGPIVKPGYAERATVADPLAEDLPAVAQIVTIFPDGAEKYLTDKFWTVDA